MNDPANSDVKRHRLFHERRSQLITAVYSSNSAFNGDLIYKLLDELRQLHDKSLAIDFEKCEALVKQWKDTWYPDFS